MLTLSALGLAQGWDVSATVSRALECGAELEAEVRSDNLLLLL